MHKLEPVGYIIGCGDSGLSALAIMSSIQSCKTDEVVIIDYPTDVKRMSLEEAVLKFSRPVPIEPLTMPVSEPIFPERKGYQDGAALPRRKKFRRK